jgi:hypothetical protein
MCHSVDSWQNDKLSNEEQGKNPERCEKGTGVRKT